jgi:hypothetical protein
MCISLLTLVLVQRPLTAHAPPAPLEIVLTTTTDQGVSDSLHRRTAHVHLVPQHHAKKPTPGPYVGHLLRMMQFAYFAGRQAGEQRRSFQRAKTGSFQYIMWLQLGSAFWCIGAEEQASEPR